MFSSQRGVAEAVRPPTPKKAKLLFPSAIPRLSTIVGSADHEKKRKIAVKCLELEEMLESQGNSQAEIESKVASFRALLLRQVNTANNNNNTNSGNGNLRLEQKENTELEKNQNGSSERSESLANEKKEHQKKKKKQRKETKHSKRKKEKRKRYCSSPTYSDYEPENTLLKQRRNRDDMISQKRSLDKDEKVSEQKSRKKKKRKHRMRSNSRSRSKSATCSRSHKRKSRSKERSRKKNKRNHSRSDIDCKQEKLPEAVPEKISNTKSIPVQIKDSYENKHENVESCTQKNIPAAKIEKEGKLNSGCKENYTQKELLDSDDIKKEKGKIIFSKIEDIPCRADSPTLEFENEPKNVLEIENKETTSTKLRFEINVPQKRNQLTTQTSSTFAELSNKLGPTVSFNHRKIGINHNIKNPLLEQKTTENRKIGKKPIGNGESTTNEGTEVVQLDNDEAEEVVFLKSSKSRSKSIIRSRSRSYSSSQSRSRSYSRSSYSRSRSRSFSISRSYSSYSSRSRSRSRSPSIQRRRGSPSFLDKRRITSARKRPIPYHRPTPSPTPSFSSRSSCSRSRSRSRERCRSRS